MDLTSWVHHTENIQAYVAFVQCRYYWLFANTFPGIVCVIFCLCMLIIITIIIITITTIFVVIIYFATDAGDRVNDNDRRSSTPYLY